MIGPTPIPNDYAVRGTVVYVNRVSRTIILDNVISTPGEGVGTALEPGWYVAPVADGVAMPAVGRTVTAHADGWWLPVSPIAEDVYILLAETSEQLVTLIDRLAGLREQFDESNAEHAHLSDVIHYLAAAHNATGWSDADFDYDE